MLTVKLRYYNWLPVWIDGRSGGCFTLCAITFILLWIQALCRYDGVVSFARLRRMTALAGNEECDERQ